MATLPNGWWDAGNVDPMASPFFFSTGQGGDDTSTQNSYRDSIFSQVFAGVPGMEQFYRASPGGDDTSASGINPELLQQYLQQNGYSLRNGVNGGGGRVWAEDGSGGMIGTPQEYSNADTNFGIASAALGAAGGSFLGGLNGLGSIGSGALAGGAAGGMNDPSLQSIGKGALIGGALGGLKDYMMPSGYSGADFGDGSAFPAGDGTAWTPSADPLQQMTLPQGWADLSDITGPINDALARPIPQLDGMSLGPISDASGGSVSQFVTNGGGATQGFQPMPETYQYPNIMPMEPYDASLPFFPTSPELGNLIPAIGAAAIPAVSGGGGGGGMSDLVRAGVIGAGAIAGAQPTGGGTATQQSRLDPRMEEMLYGQGGLLGNMKDWYAANKSGTNATILEGQNQQLGLLRDPNTMQGLQRLQQSGMGLMGGSVAGNPFAQTPFKFPG